MVRKPDGRKQEVVVEISEEALKAAEQVTRGATIEEAFWTSQAESFLSDFIWNDGNVPVSGKLILKGMDLDVLVQLAAQKRGNE